MITVKVEGSINIERQFAKDKDAEKFLKEIKKQHNSIVESKVGKNELKRFAKENNKYIRGEYQAKDIRDEYPNAGIEKLKVTIKAD